jgi:hypothetical protein
MEFEMHRVVEDHGKKRLVEAVDIASAILLLSAKGVPAERLLSEMLKMFYVDLDQYNAVIRGAVANDRRSAGARIAA